MSTSATLRAIKLKCLECSGGNRGEVESCEVHDCPLHPFRLGKDPEFQKATPKKRPTKKKNKTDDQHSLF